jgi:hypothetical protein
MCFSPQNLAGVLAGVFEAVLMMMSSVMLVKILNLIKKNYLLT